MTQTDCYDCLWSENCDWGLIFKNMIPMSVPCQAKAWHVRSLKVFDEQKDALREKIGGHEVVHARIVTVGDFCEGSKPWPVKKEDSELSVKKWKGLWCLSD